MSGEYGDMSRGELLTRLEDWMKVATDRSTRIVELEAERDRLQGLINAVREARNPTIAVGLPADEVGRRARAYFEAIDRLLDEANDE